MASSHNEALPEAVPSNGIFPDMEASSMNVTTVKEEEDDEEMSPSPPPSPRALLHDYPAPIDARIKQEEDDVEMPPSPPQA